MMVSVDQQGIYRVHKLRAIRLMAEKNFLVRNDDFEEGEDPKKITNLKGATYQQLKEVQVITDYVFCTLLTSTRLTYLEPEKIQNIGSIHWQLRESQPKVKITNVLHHHGLVICSLVITPTILQNSTGTTNLPVTLLKHFPIVGPQAHMAHDPQQLLSIYQKPSIGLDINQKYFIFVKKHMTAIDHIKVPRLHWDDRRIEYQVAVHKMNQAKSRYSDDFQDKQDGPTFQAEAQALLPKKLIVCGRYRDLDVPDSKKKNDADNSE